MLRLLTLLCLAALGCNDDSLDQGERKIAAGYAHTCVPLRRGSMQCWGDNVAGQLGDGTHSNRLVPVAVSGFITPVRIAAGYRHTCAVLSDGTVQCWGFNHFGQLGDGTTAERYVPTTVPGIGIAVGIAAGGSHTCALIKEGSVQ